MKDQMVRKPTYAGKVGDKDSKDIIYWAKHKTVQERLAESWRLNCINHGIPLKSRMDRSVSSAKKR